MGLYCKVSAPGKVILHGEHSVVYGKTAIAASLGIRTSASIKEQKDDHHYISITLTNVSVEKLVFPYDDIKTNLFAKTTNIPFTWCTPETVDHDAFLPIVLNYWLDYQRKNRIELTETQSQSVLIVLYLYCALMRDTKWDFNSFDLNVKTDLMIGSGIGSSASYAVSLAAIMLLYLRLKLNDDYHSILKNTLKSDCLNGKIEFSNLEKKLISNWAYCGEKISHGNPSGIDNTICTYGALVEFKKGFDSTEHHLVAPLKVCLVNTNVGRNTKALVKKVADFKAKYTKIVDCLLEAFDQIAKKALEVIRCINSAENMISAKEHYDQLAELFILNHDLLRSLGVSHPSLESAVSISKELGFSCKLTGAGGGGFAIVLIPPYAEDAAIQSLIMNLKANNLDGKVSCLGGAGVTIDDLI